MDAQRWERIQDLFHRAADLPAADQQSLLAAECAEDPEMVAEVTALLREDASGSPLLDDGTDLSRFSSRLFFSLRLFCVRVILGVKRSCMPDDSSRPSL